MNNHINVTDAGREYAAAYAAQYTTRDLPLALRLYRQLLRSHPGTREFDYSRTQVQNIVRAVVPMQELLEAELELAQARLNGGR